MSSKLGKILIPISNDIITKYDFHWNQGLFDNNNLVLVGGIDDYKITQTFYQQELVIGMGSTLIKPTQNYYGFELTCKDARIDIINALNDIIYLSRRNPSEYELIACQDYFYPAFGADYTSRQCTISYELTGGGFRGENTFYGKGVRLMFTDFSNYQ